MSDLSTCAEAVLTYIKDAVAGGYFVDLDGLSDDVYLTYPKEEIIEAIRELKKRELILVKQLYRKDEKTGFVVYGITNEGRDLV